MSSKSSFYEVPVTAIKLEDREMAGSLSPMSFNGDRNTPSPLLNSEINDPLSLIAKETVMNFQSQFNSNSMGKSLKLVPLDKLPKNLKCIKKLPVNCSKKPVQLVKVSPEQVRVIRTEVAQVKSDSGLKKTLAKVKTGNSLLKEPQEKKRKSCAKHYVETHRTIVPKEVLKAEMDKILKKSKRSKKEVKKGTSGEFRLPTTKEIREHFTSAMSEEFRKIFTV